MARNLRLAGDNALAALQQTMRSRMRQDEAMHRVNASSAGAPTRKDGGQGTTPAAAAPINGAKADGGQVLIGTPDRIDGTGRPHAASSPTHTVTVPWPPTGNTSVRHGNGSHYLRKEVLDYRRQVAELCMGAPRMTGTYRLKVAFSPPDKRQRDMDNALKSLLDALVLAGFLPSDSMTYMRELYACVVDKRAGIVVVTAEAM